MRSRLNFAGTALIADWLLQTLSISLPAFRIAGGLLLFSIALFQIRNTVRPGTPRNRRGSGDPFQETPLTSFGIHLGSRRPKMIASGYRTSK